MERKERDGGGLWPIKKEEKLAPMSTTACVIMDRVTITSLLSSLRYDAML